MVRAYSIRDFFLTSGYMDDVRLIDQSTEENFYETTKNTFRPANILTDISRDRRARSRLSSSLVDRLVEAQQQTRLEEWVADHVALRKASGSFWQATYPEQVLVTPLFSEQPQTVRLSSNVGLIKPGKTNYQYLLQIEEQKPEIEKE